MPTLFAQIAPQRSTQYAEWVNALAPIELQLSPLGTQISEIQPRRLGGQDYIELQMSSLPDDTQWRETGLLATIRGFFQYYEQLGDLPGPFLRPIEPTLQTALPLDLVMTRRYKGKTNELFTWFLLNVARFSSSFARQGWDTLRVLDPLAGGGTSLFMGLVLGADVAGVEQDLGDVESTAVFLEQYCRQQGIACKIREERLRKLGRRWSFAVGKEHPQRCLLAHGDTAQSKELLSGFKPHLVVADLPYGIQHQGQLRELLQSLPVWSAMLAPGGAIVLAWDATRFSRPEMIAFVRSVCPLVIRDDPPYNQLSHRVDRVIKQRDLLVGQLIGTDAAPGPLMS
jgi:hypothetical protein